MRRFISCLIILASSIFLTYHYTYSGGIIVHEYGGTPATTTAASECDGKLICQNWEAAPSGGEDNSEDWVRRNAATEDDNSTAVVLRGTYSFQAGEQVYHDYTIASATSLETFGFFRWRATAAAANNQVFWLSNGGYGDPELQIYQNGSGYWEISHGGVTAASSVTPLANTTYYVWFRYKPGTGANGEADLYVSTDRTNKGSAIATLTNGADTESWDRPIMINQNASASYFDQILIDDATWGTIAE